MALPAIAFPALAQNAPSLEADNLVLSRPRPGLDPQGFRAGGFDIFPSLSAGVSYDDNIYETDADRVSSPIVTVSPAVSARSSWNRHALNMEAGATFERFTDRKTENNNRYNVGADGRLDALDWLRFDASGHYLKTIEARGSAGDIFSAGEPIRFRNGGGGFGLTADLSKIHLSAGGKVERITYQDVRIGTASFSQAYRNRVYSSGSFALAYDISPSLQPFARVDLEYERYDVRDRDSTFDSHGAVALGGFNISLTKLLTGRVSAGYRWRDYRNPAYSNTRGFTYDIALVWNPRTLLSVTLDAQKAIDESPYILSSGIIRNQGSIKFDYELYRNLIIQAGADYATEKYRGIDRTDRRVTATINLQYLMNRFIHANLRYDLRRQDGHGTLGRTYRDNVIGLSLTFQR